MLLHAIIIKKVLSVDLYESRKSDTTSIYVYGYPRIILNTTGPAQVMTKDITRRQHLEYDAFVECTKGNVSDNFNILDRVRSLDCCTVIDLGCGTGNHTVKLAEKVGPNGVVIGVDPDKERICVANTKWAKDNLTFVAGDEETFPEGQYDLFFSYYAVHWIKRKQLLFKRVYKNLKPGGQFAFVVSKETSHLGKEISSLMGPEGAKQIYNQWHFCSSEEYERLAKDAGFAEVTLCE